MLHPTHKIALGVVLVGIVSFVLLPNFMWGQKEKPRSVKDEAKLFGEKAIADANAIIAKIKEKHQKDLWIETVENGPEKAAAAKWAEKRAADAGVDGVYIVISTEPKIFEIVISPKTRDKGYFTNANRDEIKKILAKNLKGNKDEALLKVAQYTLDKMNEQVPKNEPRVVKDDAKLFSEDAIKDANAIVAKIRAMHQKDLFIETLEKGPDVKEFAAWTRERADKLGVDGVYVLITKEPKHFQVIVGDKTRESGIFTISDRDEMAKMLKGLAKDRDETLLKVTTFVLEAMNQRKRPDKGDDKETALIIQAKVQIMVLDRATRAYHIKNKEWPMSLNVLVENKLLESEASLVDPWGRRYLYNPSGAHNKSERADIWTSTPRKENIGNWPTSD